MLIFSNRRLSMTGLTLGRWSNPSCIKRTACKQGLKGHLGESTCDLQTLTESKFVRGGLAFKYKNSICTFQLRLEFCSHHQYPVFSPSFFSSPSHSLLSSYRTPHTFFFFFFFFKKNIQPNQPKCASLSPSSLPSSASSLPPRLSPSPAPPSLSSSAATTSSVS
ncbi:hypothetical protein BB8028_0004g09820 [Beauveria bassiana]|uniref:Uncharacterized protein n=1 Tax=Beauveria bassiana TaxID=176275 RepID=A0A2S7YCZ3_BEABA|nr:hypothetical protein BB8028_0004g09820 [Beauveria bassiana]